MTVAEEDIFDSQLYQLLRSTTGLAGVDANTLRQSTITLNKNFYNKPRCVLALIKIACNADQSPIRQIAAIEARKRSQVYWLECGYDVTRQAQALLLERLFCECERGVVIALARLISAIASQGILMNHWPELVSSLLLAGQSQTLHHREIATLTFSYLLQVVSPKDLGSLFTEVMNLLSVLLSDADSRSVRITALECFREIADHVTLKDKQSIAYFQSQLPTMMRVVEDVMVAGDHDSSARGLAVFDELISGDAPIFSSLAEFVHFVCQSFANLSYAPQIRINAGNLLSLLPIYKTKQMIKLKLIQPVLNRILPITAEPEPTQFDEDEDSPSRIAIRCVHAFGLNFPPAQVFPLIYSTIGQYAVDSTSLDKRRASVLILALIVDGCADTVRSHLDELVTISVNLLQDYEPKVRMAACLCISAMGECLEIGNSHHTQILPALFMLMQDQSHAEVLRTATNALDTILDGLGDAILPYVDGLMTVLMQIFVALPDTKMRQVVVGAIGSAANASSEQFKPYFDRVAPMILDLMALNNFNDHDLMLLRGISIDTMSAIADAVGPDTFRPCLALSTQLTREAMYIAQVPKLKECAFCYFGVLTRMYKSEFSSILPELVPLLLSSIEASEPGSADDDNLFVPDTKTSGINEFNGKDDSFMIDADEMGSDDDDDSEAFNVSSAFADEKSTAIDVLSDLFDSMESQFLPYLDSSVAAILDNTDDYHDTVRKAVALGLFKILDTAHRITNNLSPWLPGLPLTSPFQDDFRQILNVILKAVIKMLGEEDDRIVAAEICGAIHNALCTMGPVIVSEPGHLESVVHMIALILDGRHLSQQDDEDIELDLDELAEYDALLISSAADVVSSLACALGGKSFTPFAGRFFTLLARYFTSTAQVSERSMAVGTFSEIVAGIKSDVTHWHAGMVDIFQRALNDPSAEVRSNGIYGLGLLAQYSDVPYSPDEWIGLVLPSLNSSDLPNERDNAAGTTARILLRNDHWTSHSNYLPFLFACLPIRVDFEEIKTVQALLIRILRSAAAGEIVVANEIIKNTAPQFVDAVSYFFKDDHHNSDPSTLSELSAALTDAKACSCEFATYLNQSGLSYSPSY